MTDGHIIRIAGPVVAATGLQGVRLYDTALVGEQGLVGEVIRLAGAITTIQVYEDTSGVRVGEPVQASGSSLTVDLGPGLLGQVYDGLQRPLKAIAGLSGDFIQRGTSADALSITARWKFTPAVHVGDAVTPGTILGSVPETPVLDHRILVPHDMSGYIRSIEAGDFTVHDTIAIIETERGEHPLTMLQRWPVRQPRPFNRKLLPNERITTGTRVIDTFFPVARGGSAIIPGGFGTGKTVVQHSLARWSDVDIVIYVGCGERGNEMTEVLDEFPHLEDPRTGSPLMERTVLIANTSDMPVAAREASIYTGATIGEYYRDMGYHVLMLADSTSRWGEALREISGRLEEMPGEEGYPAYLGSRLSEFYERSGRVTTLDGQRTGSVTIIGTVSPPGGDFSEPMTQNSIRVVGTYWALEYELSRRRHFPAISWTNSYSLYELPVTTYEDWHDLTRDAMTLLQQEIELEEIVQLVGPDALTDGDRLILFVARMLREDFLQQSAFDPVDQHSPLNKTYVMLKALMDFYGQAEEALAAGTSLEDITGHPVVSKLARMKSIASDEAQTQIGAWHGEMRQNGIGSP